MSQILFYFKHSYINVLHLQGVNKKDVASVCIWFLNNQMIALEISDFGMICFSKTTTNVMFS